MTNSTETSRTDAPMQKLGELDGRTWYWAEPGRFTDPGVVCWDHAAKKHFTIADLLTEERARCARALDQRTADRTYEHGHYDPDTGATECPPAVDSLNEETDDCAETIRKLK